jgi:hypothetical protein
VLTEYYKNGKIGPNELGRACSTREEEKHERYGRKIKKSRGRYRSTENGNSETNVGRVWAGLF